MGIVKGLSSVKQYIDTIGIVSFHGFIRQLADFADRDAGLLSARISQLTGERILRRFDLPFEVVGAEKIFNLKNYSIVANHLSYLDWGLLFAAFPVPLRFIAKKELTHLPAIGSWLQRYGVLIDRKNGKSAKDAIRAAARDSRNWPMVIFPEGTRSHDGEMAPFKKGGLITLAEEGVSLLPVTIVGTYEALSRHDRAVRCGKPLKVIVHDPVHPKDFDSPTAFIDAIEKLIRECYDAERPNLVG